MKKKLLSLLLAIVLICTSVLGQNFQINASAEESKKVVRIAGAGRIDTSLSIADIYKEIIGVDKFKAVVVATGKNFADALPGSYLAVQNDAPILLTSDARMDDIAAYIKANMEKTGKVYILGGEAAVSASLEKKLVGYKFERLAGANRYETNLKILKAAGVADGEMIVATGRDFADSLSASAVKTPILMVKNELTEEQRTYLNSLDIDEFYIVGGTGAVSEQVMKELKTYGSVERISGANRRETSVAVAEKFFDEPASAVVASASNFPDGLCGGPLAAALNVPLILTVNNKVNEADTYATYNDIHNGYVLGGSSALSDKSVVNVFDLTSANEIEGSVQEKEKIQVAVKETAYGSLMWEEVCEEFTAETGIEVELIVDRYIEDIIETSMMAGEYPDVVHLSTGYEEKLTERMIENEMLADITDVLSMKVPGETALVSEKIAGGFTESYLTNPYDDGKTYLAPMFYSPCGLFYNAGLLEENGWEVPTTWDEMWELGDKAADEGIALFTYPTTGYLDAFLYSLMYSAGGPEFFNQARVYERGIWETEEAEKCFEILEKLAEYTHDLTPYYANYEDFTLNQQMVLDNEAIFMPNGTWIVGEMGDAPRADGFEWGMTAVPAVEEGKDSYTYAWMEQSWIPANAENIDAAKQFIAYLYSDEACDIFADAGAAQPVIGVEDKFYGTNKLFYSVFDTGAKAALGNFGGYKLEDGIGTIQEVFLDPMNDLVFGDITISQWVSEIIYQNNLMRANLQ